MSYIKKILVYFDKMKIIFQPVLKNYVYVNFLNSENYDEFVQLQNLNFTFSLFDFSIIWKIFY